MAAMDWITMVSALQARGWSQARIADRCGCAQSAISDLAAGRTRDPRYSLGEKLAHLAAEVAGEVVSCNSQVELACQASPVINTEVGEGAHA